jgi:glycosyltransferase involved in cell wall biosynthesis
MQPVSQPVSIVVTVLNEAGDIGRVVHSLLAQTPVAAEVIVVDGGSSDGTWEWLAETQTKDPRLVAIRDETCSLKYSAGPVSRGRNVAIAAAASGIIATADAGCTYAPDWVANLSLPAQPSTLWAAPALTPPITPCGTWHRLPSSASSSGPQSPQNPAPRGPWPLRAHSGSASGDFPRPCS